MKKANAVWERCPWKGRGRKVDNEQQKGKVEEYHFDRVRDRHPPEFEC